MNRYYALFTKSLRKASVNRAAATRQLLIDEGRRAFGAKGHDGVSLQRDVLDPSGVSNGSFYHQFSDKTDLLVAVLEDASERGRDALMTARPAPSSGSLSDHIEGQLDTWFGVVDADLDLFRIMLREHASEDPRVREGVRSIRQRWSEALAIEIAQLAPATATGLDADVAAGFVVALVVGLLPDYIDAPPRRRRARRRELVTSLTPFLLGGLAALGGISTPAPTSG